MAHSVVQGNESAGNESPGSPNVCNLQMNLDRLSVTGQERKNEKAGENAQVEEMQMMRSSGVRPV
jgi:hypothetical protein